ncbi:MAG: hypothetical protein A2821_02275 [Candidatus Magasanikbacteria bacterium RIFCSPHIGHO2_01_FULL_41_23]|uniref:NYN domain-containing protein n=1 Tax=Candidatus Magasanikbacteria bacterium RIFCSPLOWO2_01_FULL_40_15 TaxID=1798686 RepID=A0A1F6N2J6_9BACT|nr:MAG: hypothetical protein A2821_02275 [Candidatus Magasanikbacteria bacterium RIFCSPHIGHO2_01_FULL_41_23]OGH66843.1 MAG: hypothetical protein A3C66_02060 [Candidatus Magasanikbacteria bacterium RIFCSPHIGHO2_02_FULL_41_35]OGH74826.1 MAG: hypothetical protein A3F22_03985 [Candidatus Magasanikbacteria bacterium RIFCSPHIGHO2_12_FULL_41_16]OGH78102.1 MAG: hypothetical protein A2983_03410 [Candidatus Magasanikbacteria bacterium RIFCSPLOWO2_01_FULL_40_15]
MNYNQNNFAFIDSQNLHFGILEQGWKIDYRKFRNYLRNKYDITKVFMFMGYLPSEQALYTFLRQSGFTLIFKHVSKLLDGSVKGNCDGEMILQAMIEYPNYHQALLITGDGDFVCLIKYLQKQNKLLQVIAPTLENCSKFIREVAGKKLLFFNDLQSKLSYKDKKTL